MSECMDSDFSCTPPSVTDMSAEDCLLSSFSLDAPIQFTICQLCQPQDVRQTPESFLCVCMCGCMGVPDLPVTSLLNKCYHQTSVPNIRASRNLNPTVCSEGCYHPLFQRTNAGKGQRACF